MCVGLEACLHIPFPHLFSALCFDLEMQVFLVIHGVNVLDKSQTMNTKTVILGLKLVNSGLNSSFPLLLAVFVYVSSQKP